MRPRSKLPALPKEVYSTLGSVPVERPDSLAAEGQPEENMGDVNFLTRIIRISTKLSPAAAWHTLEHERVHLALWDAGVVLSHETEELICDVIATARVAEMVARLSPVQPK